MLCVSVAPLGCAMLTLTGYICSEEFLSLAFDDDSFADLKKSCTLRSRGWLQLCIG